MASSSSSPLSLLPLLLLLHWPPPLCALRPAAPCRVATPALPGRSRRPPTWSSAGANPLPSAAIRAFFKCFDDCGDLEAVDGLAAGHPGLPCRAYMAIWCVLQLCHGLCRCSALELWGLGFFEQPPLGLRNFLQPKPLKDQGVVSLEDVAPRSDYSLWLAAR